MDLPKWVEVDGRPARLVRADAAEVELEVHPPGAAAPERRIYAAATAPPFADLPPDRIPKPTG